MRAIWTRLVNPLRSRKARVAIATVITAYLAEWGLDVSPTLLVTILGVGASLILGIAHEDHAVKRNGNAHAAATITKWEDAADGES